MRAFSTRFRRSARSRAMSSYERLAASYDELTEDVDYQRRADFLERLFQRARLPVHTVLDLACGTGTMTWLLTARGYELIAVDGSEDMLAAAAAKTGPGIPPGVPAPVDAAARPVRNGRRGDLLSRQSQLSDKSPRRAAHLRAAAPVHRARRYAHFRREHAREVPPVSTGRSTSTRRRTPTASGARSSAAGYAATMSTSLTCGRTARGSAGSSITASAATPPRS